MEEDCQYKQKSCPPIAGICHRKNQAGQPKPSNSTTAGRFGVAPLYTPSPCRGKIKQKHNDCTVKGGFIYYGCNLAANEED